MPACSTAWQPLRLRHLHRAHALGGAGHARPLRAVAALRSHHRHAGSNRAQTASRRPAEDRRSAIQAARSGTSAIRWTTRAAPAPQACLSSASHRPHSPRRSDLVALFQAENAIAVLNDINQLEGVLTDAKRNHSTRHQRDPDPRHAQNRRPRAVSKSPPASASSITCWSSSPSMAASI